MVDGFLHPYILPCSKEILCVPPWDGVHSLSFFGSGQPRACELTVPTLRLFVLSFEPNKPHPSAPNMENHQASESSGQGNVLKNRLW